MFETANHTYHLIHANVAIMRAPLDDPLMAGFVDLADEIDILAQNSPGFVAQPTPPDEGQVFTGRVLLNISIPRYREFFHTIDPRKNLLYNPNAKTNIASQLASQVEDQPLRGLVDILVITKDR